MLKYDKASTFRAISKVNETAKLSPEFINLPLRVLRTHTNIRGKAIQKWYKNLARLCDRLGEAGITLTTTKLSFLWEVGIHVTYVRRSITSVYTVLRDRKWLEKPSR